MSGCGCSVLFAALLSNVAWAAAPTGSVQPTAQATFAASPAADSAIDGRLPSDSAISLLLSPGSANHALGLPGLTEGMEAAPLPVPSPPPLGGKATTWIFAAAIAVAFVSFGILAATASGGG